jgi:hypothetical protein
MTALVPAYLSFDKSQDGPGGWMDADFWGMVSGAIFQLLGLCTQIVAPLIFPSYFVLNLDGFLRRLVWGLVVFVSALTLIAVLVYGFASIKWSGVLFFLGQAILGLVQLILVFRPQ